MAAEAPLTDVLCAVCGVAIDAPMSAECNWCNTPFHLNQRNDVEAQDCGEVWIDEQHLALQFACNTCLATESGPSAPTREPSASRVPGRAVAPRATRSRRYKKRP